MLSNYLKIALRNLIKHKSQTLINVGGLTLGFVCAIIIFLTIQYEFSYDTWHPDRDRIYRIVREEFEFGNIDYDDGIHYPLAEAVREDISGIEKLSIVNTNFPSPIIIHENEQGVRKKFKENQTALVHQDYFDIIHHEWIAGDREGALTQPNKAVVTGQFAEKVFGTVDVIGKIISLDIYEPVEVEVVGVVKKAPENSDFPFELLISHNSKTVNGNTSISDSWDSSSSAWRVFLKLAPGVTAEEIDAQFDPILAKNKDQKFADDTRYYLQALSDIHFNTTFSNYGGRVIEKRVLYAIGLIGILLLLAACINFINLNTAVAVRRSKEVGLRKTFGGTKSQLTLHFLGETSVTCLIAILLALAVSEFALLFVEPLIGFTPDLSLLGNPSLLLLTSVLFVLITLGAGWYPARYLSNFSPINAIRNNITAKYGQGLNLRRSLIVVQFTITQILIISTVIIGSQMNYFQSSYLGFNKDAIIEVPISSATQDQLRTFKNQVKNFSGIENVTFSNTGTANGNVWGGNYNHRIDTSMIEGGAEIKYIDIDFVDTYALKLLAGTNVMPTDTLNQYLVNETYAKQLGYNENNYHEIIGQLSRIWGNEAPIVGVVADFTTQSFHNEQQAVMLGIQNNYSQAAIKIDASRTQEALEHIEKVFDAVFEVKVFDYWFLDDQIATFYNTEQRLAQTLNVFTIIAIVIGCLGLFGLVSYMATTRTKEIGVRKVLGASVRSILQLFGKELSILLGASFLIAAPVSYYFMNEWLSEFAYKITIGVEIFLISLMGTLAVALLTVGYKSLKAAFANPVDSLKVE